MPPRETLWITGARGFLGAHLLRAARAAGFEARGLARRADVAEQVEAFDFAAPGGAAAFVRERRPQAVMNAAAYATGARCLADPTGARRMNADLPGELAAACAQAGARFVHLSTDLVFDGEHAPYREEDEARPTSRYGATKLAGERAVLERHPEALVVRLPLLYGDAIHEPRGASAMVETAARSGVPAALFVDEWRSPLAVDAVAGWLVALLGRDVRGLLHLGSRDRISRYGLGRALLERLGLHPDTVHPCRQADVPSNEPRPRDVSLDVARALALGIELPTALEGVRLWRPRARG